MECVDVGIKVERIIFFIVLVVVKSSGDFVVCCVIRWNVLSKGFWKIIVRDVMMER